ncbi:VOC family protein [Marinifilum sp. N1E240]|uniref:VOC family protein n=1 Tax=Marinifilum sp. N1E240 TaxID=2608082 RepID=UPI00128DE41A|nr:VOC family protein [Marinifilum sp. N1E240]MPQ47534.1 VOC family protein [Marinifilum sp. N1E240]
MENIMHAFTWVEIPVTDFERAKKFYSKIFDFEMPQEQMGKDLMGFFQYDFENGGVGGAIVKGEMYKPGNTGTMAYLDGGADLNIVLNRIEDAGGKVQVPKTQITPEIGFFAIFSDTEGNRVALHSRK